MPPAGQSFLGERYGLVSTVISQSQPECVPTNWKQAQRLDLSKMKQGRVVISRWATSVLPIALPLGTCLRRQLGLYANNGLSHPLRY